ncbi:MAG: AMP-binding protein [Gammaproteobacteria bacterium]|nr:AMP-binding protein [Gammaproteobacteria bacterium]
MQDYNEIYKEFRWPRPARYNFVREVIDCWATGQSEKLALWWVNDHGHELRRTFADVAAASRRLCNLLTQAGVRRGDTVLLILPRVPEWWEALTACLRMGAVAAPGTVQLSAKDLEYRIQASRGVCVITDAANAEKIDAIAANCPTLKTRILVGAGRHDWLDYAAALAAQPAQFVTVDTAADEDALCYFTSGTTGFPKMCIHAHSYALGHQTTGRYWLDLGPDDLHWNISDTGWAKAAWSSFFGPWTCGATLFVHHSAGFSAKRTMELLDRYPITTMCGAPTIYRMLVLEDLARYRPKALRHCVGAGEPLNPEVIEKWKRATGLTIRDGYGQTETVILCGSFLGIEPRFGSMGKPAPGITLAIVDESGAELPPDSEGNIGVKVKPESPLGLFKEYRGAPDKTAATRIGDWYLTGDRAYRDREGYFWFVSRADDLIISAGYRIGPFEVESALIEHPAVAESAVVASPDETRGEVVKAFVVLAPGFSPSDVLKKEIQEHVKRITAPYKYPRKIDFVTELPKTVSGKIRRVELRQKEWAVANAGRREAGPTG